MQRALSCARPRRVHERVSFDGTRSRAARELPAALVRPVAGRTGQTDESRVLNSTKIPASGFPAASRMVASTLACCGVLGDPTTCTAVNGQRIELRAVFTGVTN